MRTVCKGCLHEPACQKWEKSIEDLTGFVVNNENVKPCSIYVALSRPAPVDVEKVLVEMEKEIIVQRRMDRRYMADRLSHYLAALRTMPAPERGEGDACKGCDQATECRIPKKRCREYLSYSAEAKAGTGEKGEGK